MRTNVIFYLLMLLGTITSCEEDLETMEPILLGTDHVNFYKSKPMFDEASGLRSQEEYSSPFSIDHIQRNGDILTVEVSFAKDCEGTFHVIWDGAIMESYPMQANLFLKFDATGCPKEFIQGETTKKIITIDLVEFIGDEQLVKETIFHVSNASSHQDVSCMGNCDETVTND